MYRNKAKRWVTTATMSLMHKISVIKLLPIPKNNRNMQNKNNITIENQKITTTS